MDIVVDGLNSLMSFLMNFCFFLTKAEHNGRLKTEEAASCGGDTVVRGLRLPGFKLRLALNHMLLEILFDSF